MFIKQQRMTPEQQERYQFLKQKCLSKVPERELVRHILKVRPKMKGVYYNTVLDTEVEYARRKSIRMWEAFGINIDYLKHPWELKEERRDFTEFMEYSG